jgi:pimeloyl-ACP methyl ester carboxylesterase
MGERAQVVLVHGGWGSPGQWAGVHAALAERGVVVVCADLPTMRAPSATVADDVAHVRSLIGDAPSVVCGHSYGGLVVTQAAAGHGLVRHLVYVAAAVPKFGESMMDVVMRRPMPMAPPTFRDDGTVVIDQWPGGEGAYEPAVNALLAQNPPRPFAAAALGTPAGEVAGWDLPSTYFIATRDTVIHPDTQREIASHAKTTIELDCDHMALVVFPDQIAAILASAALS